MSLACLNCGSTARAQCKKCKRAYYCSEDCKHDDWKVSHSIECVAGVDVDAAADNLWTGIFRTHAENYISWLNTVNTDCDPMSASAVAARTQLVDHLSKLKDQSDRRFSSDITDTYIESLTRYGTATILHDEAAHAYQRGLKGGQIGDIARVFGIVKRQENLTKEDYESAWLAHVQGLINYTEAVKSNCDEKELDEKLSAAIDASVHAGQTFWGRKWRPLTH